LLWKIWSRWRNRYRSLQSLNIIEHRPGEKLIRLEPEGGWERTRGLRYPENAPGPFYVQRDWCLVCRFPETIAPNLIGFADKSVSEYEHCYFKKQPVTPEETDRAIRACEATCCGAYHYAGNDESIKQRFRDARCADVIDEF